MTTQGWSCAHCTSDFPEPRLAANFSNSTQTVLRTPNHLESHPTPVPLESPSGRTSLSQLLFRCFREKITDYYTGPFEHREIGNHVRTSLSQQRAESAVAVRTRTSTRAQRGYARSLSPGGKVRGHQISAFRNHGLSMQFRSNIVEKSIHSGCIHQIDQN